MVSLILGLGNVGRKYQGTRHNLGFELLDRLAREYRTLPSAETDLYHWCRVSRPDRELILAWPTTFMNGSGEAAKELLARHDLKPEQMLVLVDDVALPLGSIRFRLSGSAGGHNGLASLIEELQTSAFPRLRLGVGPLPPETELVEFVLSKFAKAEKPAVDQMLTRATEALLFAIDNRVDLAMSRYNSPATPDVT